MRAIVTIPPYATFLKELAEHPIVEGFRLNTVMPLKESLEETLTRLKKILNGKTLWLDLKCRQLRVARGAFFDAPKKPTILEIKGKKVVLDPSNPKSYGEIRTPPWSIIEIDHEIELDTTHPVRCYFSDGTDWADIVRIDGKKLFMLDGPKRLVGGGESLNILDPSLKIKGFLTDQDLRYIEAAKKVGIHNYMLSFVEDENDLIELGKLDGDAKIIAKIESEKGLALVERLCLNRDILNEARGTSDNIHLMAARGDLFIEVSQPHRILNATRRIVKNDPGAVVASRIMGSLKNGLAPSCADIGDVGFLREIGYSRFMIGDEICFDRKSVLIALNVLASIDEDYIPEKAK